MHQTKYRGLPRKLIILRYVQNLARDLNIAIISEEIGNNCNMMRKYHVETIGEKVSGTVICGLRS